MEEKEKKNKGGLRPPHGVVVLFYYALYQKKNISLCLLHLWLAPTFYSRGGSLEGLKDLWYVAQTSLRYHFIIKQSQYHPEKYKPRFCPFPNLSSFKNVSCYYSSLPTYIPTYYLLHNTNKHYTTLHSKEREREKAGTGLLGNFGSDAPYRSVFVGCQGGTMPLLAMLPTFCMGKFRSAVLGSLIYTYCLSYHTPLHSAVSGDLPNKCHATPPALPCIFALWENKMHNFCFCPFSILFGRINNKSFSSLLLNHNEKEKSERICNEDADHAFLHTWWW